MRPFRRRPRTEPYFTGTTWVFPCPPARVMSLEQATHGPSPNFPEGAPLAPGVCPCKLCTTALEKGPAANINVPLWLDIQEALKDESWLRVDGQAPDLTRQLIASAIVRRLASVGSTGAVQ